MKLLLTVLVICLNFDPAKKSQVLKPCNDSFSQTDMDSLVSRYEKVLTPRHTTTNVLTHSIKLNDTSPVTKTSYSVPLAYRDKFKAELEKMVKNKIIEPCNADYTSNCSIMPRKDEIRIDVCCN